MFSKFLASGWINNTIRVFSSVFSVDFDMYKPFLSFLGLNSATKCLSAKIAIGRFL